MREWEVGAWFRKNGEKAGLGFEKRPPEYTLSFSWNACLQTSPALGFNLA
jgi:hypothetical protein